MQIWSKTRAGKASSLLIVAMFGLFFLGVRFFSNRYDSVAAGETILSDLAARPGLAISMLSGFASGVAAFIVGLVAIIKYMERSVLVFMTTFIGMLLTVFLFSELLFSH